MDFAAALTTASATIGLVKSLKDLDHDLDKSELKAKMVELYENLAEVKMALVDAQVIAKDKEQEIEELKDKLRFREALIEIQGFKYNEVGGKPNGYPFCPTCEVKEEKFYRLAIAGNPNRSVCKNCNNVHQAGPDGAVNVIEPKSPQPQKVKNSLARRRR